MQVTSNHIGMRKRTVVRIEMQYFEAYRTPRRPIVEYIKISSCPVPHRRWRQAA
jgi:hypothetical protein